MAEKENDEQGIEGLARRNGRRADGDRCDACGKQPLGRVERRHDRVRVGCRADVSRRRRRLRRRVAPRDRPDHGGSRGTEAGHHDSRSEARQVVAGYERRARVDVQRSARASASTTGRLSTRARSARTSTGGTTSPARSRPTRPRTTTTRSSAGYKKAASGLTNSPLYRSCRAVGDSTAVITLRRPNAAFLGALSLTAFHIQSPTAMAAVRREQGHALEGRRLHAERPVRRAGRPGRGHRGRSSSSRGGSATGS